MILFMQLNRMSTPKYRKYDMKDIPIALEKIRRKELSTLAASKMYGIPRTTLIDRLQGRVGDNCTRSGPP